MDQNWEKICEMPLISNIYGLAIFDFDVRTPLNIQKASKCTHGTIKAEILNPTFFWTPCILHTLREGGKGRGVEHERFP